MWEVYFVIHILFALSMSSAHRITVPGSNTPKKESNYRFCKNAACFMFPSKRLPSRALSECRQGNKQTNKNISLDISSFITKNNEQRKAFDTVNVLLTIYIYLLKRQLFTEPVNIRVCHKELRTYSGIGHLIFAF